MGFENGPTGDCSLTLNLKQVIQETGATAELWQSRVQPWPHGSVQSSTAVAMAPD